MNDKKEQITKVINELVILKSLYKDSTDSMDKEMVDFINHSIWTLDTASRDK